MSALSALLLLPAALLLDRLFGEPPARIHPVCGMGALAAAAERLLRRGPDGARMTLAGLAACLAVILPVGLLAALPVLLAGGMLGDAAAWIVCVAVVSLCLAPRCLDEPAVWPCRWNGAIWKRPAGPWPCWWGATRNSWMPTAWPGPVWRAWART